MLLQETVDIILHRCRATNNRQPPFPGDMEEVVIVRSLAIGSVLDAGIFDGDMHGRDLCVRLILFFCVHHAVS